MLIEAVIRSDTWLTPGLGQNQSFICYCKLPDYGLISGLFLSWCRDATVPVFVVLRTTTLKTVDVRRNDDVDGWSGDSAIHRHRHA
jgi:hypothetical protein